MKSVSELVSDKKWIPTGDIQNYHSAVSEPGNVYTTLLELNVPCQLQSLKVSSHSGAHGGGKIRLTIDGIVSEINFGPYQADCLGFGANYILPPQLSEKSLKIEFYITHSIRSISCNYHYVEQVQ